MHLRRSTLEKELLEEEHFLYTRTIHASALDTVHNIHAVLDIHTHTHHDYLLLSTTFRFTSQHMHRRGVLKRGTESHHLAMCLRALYYIERLTYIPSL